MTIFASAGAGLLVAVTISTVILYRRRAARIARSKLVLTPLDEIYVTNDRFQQPTRNPLYIYTYISVYIPEYIYIIYIYTHIYMYIYTFIYICISTYISIHVCQYIHVYLCIYYYYLCISTYISIHVCQ